MKVLFLPGFQSRFQSLHDQSRFFSPHSLRKFGLTYWNGVMFYNICPAVWLENFLSLFFNVLSSLVFLPLLISLLRPDVTIIFVPPGKRSIGSWFASRLVKEDEAYREISSSKDLKKRLAEEVCF